MKRVASIDIVRGLVMVLMTLDHCRDLLHVASVTVQPTDLDSTTAPVFFTRWVTHLCAPTFVFLSGASAYLSFRGKADLRASRNHFLRRGAALIAMDLTLVNFGVWWDIHFAVVLFDVLSAIGTGFIILGLLLGRPLKAILATGLAIIALHGLAPMLPLPETSLVKVALMPFFAPGAIPIAPGHTLIMGYPPIPWLGILLTGFACGRLFEREGRQRAVMFARLGVGALAGFLFIRICNGYGDPAPWHAQKDALFTFLSFLNVTKYPPSLSFCLLTLGVMFLILAAFEGASGKAAKASAVFGRVPLFFFLVHWYVIHPLMFAVVFAQGFRGRDLVFGTNFGRPPGSGLPLWGVYLAWAGVVLVLYPACRSYGRYKAAHPELKWLRYL